MRSEVALALALALAVAGCGDGRLAAPIGARRDVPPVRGGTLRVATFTDVRGLDPAIAFDEGVAPLLNGMFDTLVAYDDEGKIVPRLAESYDVSPDGTRYTFRLREARFHDGAPVRAADVKRSIERTLAHDTPCPAPSFYASIRGYGAFHDGTEGPAGTAYAPEIEGIVVDGERVLRIELREPDATLLAVLALPFAAPVCPDAGATWTRAWGLRPCGSGPFRLVEWESGREVRLARFDAHFDAATTWLDGVRWSLGVPQLTQRFQFESGELDSIRELRQPDSLRFRSDPAWKPYGEWSPSKGTRGVFLNTQMPPFDDREVRRAVAAAIDWDEIASLREGHVVRTRQILPPVVPGHDPSFRGQEHDLAAAREHMRLAGHPFDPATGRGGWPEPIPYLVTADSFDTQVAEVVQQQLAKIGVRVELRVVGWPTFLALTGRPNTVAMGRAGWSADFLDASDFFEPTLGTDAIQEDESQNNAFFSDPELDALLARAHRSTDPAARRQMYRRAEEIVRDEAPWAIGYDYRFWQVSQPYLHGFHPGLLTPMDFRHAWIDREARELARTGRALRRELAALVRPWDRRP